MAKIEYRKEFFDRNYTVREAYRRVWKYARRYRFRLFVGIVCGMLTAGTLVPFFQIVQPALQHVESHDSAVEKTLSSTHGAPSAPAPATEVKVDGTPSITPRQHSAKRKNAFEKQIERSSRLPSWYPKVERLAAKCGIRLQDEKGGMGGALALIVCVSARRFDAVSLLASRSSS